jgi:hypothetical protein
MRAARARLLDILRQRGCATTDALALLAGIDRSTAYYAMWALANKCLVVRYALPGDIGAWCPGGPPGDIAVTCNGALALLDVRKAAARLAALIVRGARSVRVAKFVKRELGLVCETGSVPRLVRGALLAMLGDCAVPDRRGGSSVLLVTDPRCALERLLRVAETGVLPAAPVPPESGCRPAAETRREGRGESRLVSVKVPREHVEMIDELVRRGAFPSRSDAVRAAIEELIGRRAGGAA